MRAMPLLPGFLFAAGAMMSVEFAARHAWLAGYVPPPKAVVAALIGGLAKGGIAGQPQVTFLTFAARLAIAAAAAVFVGVLMGAVSLVCDTFAMIVEFLRPVPSVSLIPLAILLLGLGTPMRMEVITFAALWPLLKRQFAATSLALSQR